MDTQAAGELTTAGLLIALVVLVVLALVRGCGG
jgi:hypothetical protein